MKLEPRSGSMSSDEVHDLIQAHLEQKFGHKITTWANVELKREYGDDLGPDYKAVFHGYKFTVHDVEEKK